MIKVSFWGVVFFVALGLVPPSFAEDNPAQKLTRGVVNVLSAPLEVPKQARAYWIEGSKVTDHISFWIFSGLVKGVVETVKRAGSGIWDIVTFPWSNPGGNQPLMKPDYVLQEWPTRTNGP